MIVFDASALMAFVKAEPGGEFVRDLLDDADVPFYVHSANLCEVFHLVWRRDGEDRAFATIRELLDMNIIERSDMDGAFWRDAGALIVKRRLVGASLPLGDALGIALARRLGADFVTADRAEITPLQTDGSVGVLFIR